jgi:pimeloyl-ACP methyl ester carboxylesterase
MSIPQQDQPRIFYEILKQDQEVRPWLCMVHGFSHNRQYFSAQVTRFQPDYRLFLPDLRGHGQSSGLAGPYGIEEYTDDLVGALDEAGVNQTIYWGTHTGAAIGLVLALRHPQRVSALILEGTFLPGFAMPRAAQLIDRAKSIAQSEGVQAALADWFAHADWFQYIQEHPQQCRIDGLRKMMFSFTGTPWLSQPAPKPVTAVAELLDRIRQPVLVYNGEEDLPDFKRAANHLAACLPNVQCERIAEAGGFPAWEHPSAVNELVEQFLNRA